MKLRFLLLGLAAIFACGQDPLAVLPKNYHLVYENQTVRVIDVFYAPHEKLPVHNHSDKPTVYVYLTDSGPVRFSHVEEHPFTLIRPPEKAGTFRVSPGRLEKHEVENLGDIPTEFLRVELKQVPLGFQNTSFRGRKPFDLTRSAISTEFSGPFVKIQRIVAVPHDAIDIPQSNAPALLIAFSASSVSPGADLKRGEVLWVEPHHRVEVKSPGGTAAHLLQISFLNS